MSVMMSSLRPILKRLMFMKERNEASEADLEEAMRQELKWLGIYKGCYDYNQCMKALKTMIAEASRELRDLRENLKDLTFKP